MKKKLYLPVIFALSLLIVSSCNRAESQPEQAATKAGSKSSSSQSDIAKATPSEPATEIPFALPPANTKPQRTTPARNVTNRLAELFPATQQRFSLRPGQSKTIVGEEGTRITFPADVLVTASGSAPEGPVEVSLQEYYTPAAIISAGLSTLSGDRLLQTGGMLNVRASANGQELRLRPGQNITIEFPTATLRSDMMPFQGIEKPDGSIDWRATQDSSFNRFSWDQVGMWHLYGGNVIRPMAFPGGNLALMDFLSRCSEYPADALARGKEGDAELTFTVNADGHVRGIRVGDYDFPSFGYEGVEILRQMRFCPAFGVSGKFIDQSNQTITFHFPMDSSALATLSRTDRKALTEQWQEWKTTKGVPRSYLDPILAEVEKKLDSMEVLKEESLKKLGRQAKIRRRIIAYYKVSMPALGWCNLDRFFVSGARPAVIAVSENNTKGAVFMAHIEIKDYSSYINLQMNPNTAAFTTGQIPEGTKVTLIGIDTEGEQWKMARHTLAAVNTRIEPVFKDVSEGELKEFLESM
jgi:TonB family protein